MFEGLQILACGEGGVRSSPVQAPQFAALFGGPGTHGGHGHRILAHNGLPLQGLPLRPPQGNSINYNNYNLIIPVMFLYVFIRCPLTWDR